MVNYGRYWSGLFIFVIFSVAATASEQAGGIRGMVYDADFNAPLAAAQISIAETGMKTTSTDQGNYVFSEIKPGTYTLVFSKDGYARQVKSNVVVSAGQMKEADVSLAGDFTEMEEFVVQDVQIGSGSESALLDLRMESPALMDSVGAELMSRAGAGDAASALKLVAGASVQDGKYAVVRGLPDRYVVSQMNGVRLPTADADKRAVQLDQFPSAAIESIQVSKTFTPDQQGDASGGAVNIVLKSIPDEPTVKFSSQYSWNTMVAKSDFLTYKGGGLNFWGRKKQDIPYDSIGQSWSEAAGVCDGSSPVDYKWSVAGGGKHLFENGVKLGGFGSFFYERDSSSFNDGIDDSYWIESPGAAMTPQYVQGTPDSGDFKTQLFDVSQSSQEVKWGGLGMLGLETEEHFLSLTYMYTQSAESTATLAQDTRGKAYYFPGYNVNDPTDAGNQQPNAAPYLRMETLEYTERTTRTLQLAGRHKLPDLELGFNNLFMMHEPEVDWGISQSLARMYQPDKRQFGALWQASSFQAGIPWLGIPDTVTDPLWLPFKPAANYTLGNVQHVWKDINETSTQYYVNLKLPFEQWSGDEGYMKFGLFADRTNRQYDQDSFSNFNDNAAQYEGAFEDSWSDDFSNENHPITAADIDVDYEGRQRITAGYYMADIPLCSFFNIIGGARYETTELEVTNDPESEVTWIPPGASGPVKLNAGDADVTFKQRDVLPSIGFTFTPLEKLVLRGSYSETIARQTFKELTPIQQQEFLGGEVFIGNPELKMSSLRNYDLRADYTPYEGSLLSISYFHKDIKDPIEYVQRNAGFTYTTPTNYPEGTIDGIELEARQKLGRFWEPLQGVSIGANATWIKSEVILPDDEAEQFNQPNIRSPMTKRDMTNAPDHIYNFFATYDIEETSTQLALFYTIQGDTLIAGAGQSEGKLIPNVYALEYGTLNFSLSQKLGKIWTLSFQAKNLLDPAIRTVYRSDSEGDKTKTSYRKGMEFSIGLSAAF